MSLRRPFLLLLLLSMPWLLAAQDHAAPAAATTSVDELVTLFNPDIFALNPDGSPVHGITNAFSSPASDIAREVSANNNFNMLVFFPFLILPEILLLYIVFRFRDRKDGRKPATFMGNHTLEIVWTAIPCLALVAVVVPVWQLLWKMELPPVDKERAVIIEVRGKTFAWDYKYQQDGITIGQDVAGMQEPLVIEKDRPVILNITSNDVNHAWWIPAFGVKKDAIIGRYTNTWFTPDTLGVYKGQCAELCGQGHGIMFISSVVVTPEQFSIYKALQHHRNDTVKLWGELGPAGRGDAGQVAQLVAKYLEKGDNAERRLALRFWIANNYASISRQRQEGLTPAQATELGHSRLALLEKSLAAVH